MILETLVRSLQSLNDKVDAIGKAIIPVQDNMKTALANCAFDKDLIAHLMTMAVRDLDNLEADAYAKYVEGMTALAVKRGNQQAANFQTAIQRLDKMVPDSFLANAQRRNDEIKEWQDKVDEKLKEAREAHNRMGKYLDQFKAEAVKHHEMSRATVSEAKKDMAITRDEVRKEAQESLSDLKREINKDTHAVKAKALKVAATAKESMTSELNAAKRDLSSATRDMIERKEELEKLAKQAASNIIEAEKSITHINRTLPRGRRGRGRN